MDKNNSTFKLYKNINEQIKYLKESKRIIVSDEDRHWFKEINYITMINPYKELFSNGKDAQGNHIYTADINFKELLNVIKIDFEFSNYLFKDIRKFEQKLKATLFSNLCKAYYEKENDLYSTRYINEIKIFLYDYRTIIDKLKIDEIPLLCPNVFNQLTRTGFISSGFGIEERIDLLKKIFYYGTGTDLEGFQINQSNLLVRHYLKICKTVPLWVIPNVLTLGEISMLYLMMDIEQQIAVYQDVTGDTAISDTGQIQYKKLTRFSAKLEIIRKMRNTINHYEPVFPMLTESIEKPKNIKESPIINTLCFLNKYFEFKESDNFYCLDTFLNIKVKPNPNNLVKIRLFELMVQYVQTNKENENNEILEIVKCRSNESE